MHLLNLLTGPWAIEPAKLLEMQAIYVAHARGHRADLVAIEARLGRPLANEAKPYVIDQGVAILPVEGVIAKRANMFADISGGVSTELLGRDIQAALHNPAVHSIVLAIDSPGGTVDGTQALASIVRAGAAQKPIAALASGQIASAAYWIGSAATRVYIADTTTVSGSIGVVANHTDYSKARADKGMTVTEITAGKYKRMASDNEPLSKDGATYLQTQVDYYYSLFVDAVATHRNVSAATVLATMADGRTFIGQQGIDAGLIDGIATLSALVADLAARHQTTKGTPTMQHQTKPMTRTELDQAAQAYVQAHPGTAYLAAVKMLERGGAVGSAGGEAEVASRAALDVAALAYVQAHPGTAYLAAVKRCQEAVQ